MGAPNTLAVIDQFRQAMHEAGLPYDGEIVADGERHRIKLNGDKKPDTWYVLHADGLPAGAFGCWKRQIKTSWHATPDGCLSTYELIALRADAERRKAERDTIESRQRERAQKHMAKLWEHAWPAPTHHPYLNVKGVRPHNLRWVIDALLVPVFGPDNILRGLQRIKAKEYIGFDKKFMRYTVAAGGFCVIGEASPCVCICEGWATAASIHEATGHQVFVAFSCGNLLAIARMVQKNLPTVRVILCADNDHQKPRNAGIESATEAAFLIGALLAIPQFENGDGMSDFNDLHQAESLDAVRAQIDTANIPCAVPEPTSTIAKAEPLPEVETLPASAVEVEPKAETTEEMIARLATLPDLAYFQVRDSCAKSVGITAGNMDKLVKTAKQKQNSAVAGGEGLLFEEVEAWPEAVNGAQLLNDLAATVRRFIVCEAPTARAAALWITLTWLIDTVSVAPIANITAPEPNCGKSTLLELLERLVFKPMKTDNITSAALFRTIEKWHPTLLIDEVDSFLRENEEARGVLNSGHKRNGYVIRVVGDDHEPRRFSTWGAKALCGIGSIAGTLKTRSIVLMLRRKLPSERVENLRHAVPELFDTLKRKLLRFADDAGPAIRSARPEPVTGIDNRAQDNWEPLLAIADYAGGDWPKLARTTATTLAGLEQEVLSANTELLADIQAAFAQARTDRLSTTDLVAKLCEDDERPWSTWNRGKPISPHQLAKRLGEFAISRQTFRQGHIVAKGYYLHSFKDAFARYLALPPEKAVTRLQPNNGGASSDFKIGNTAEMLLIENAPQPSNGEACNRVTDSQEGVTATEEFDL